MVDLSPKQFLGGPPQLGEILISQGLIQEAQLVQALSYKDEHGLFLGQALVALRFVTEEDLVRALRSQQLVEAIHLTPDIVDHDVAGELGYEKCSEFRCVPVNRIADHVTLAMENPSDLLSIQEVTGAMQSRILPVFAEPRRIQEALRVHFGKTVSEMSAVELGRRVDQLARELCITASVSTRGQCSDPAVVDFAEALLEEAFSQSATSLHFEARGKELHISYRRGGVLEERCCLPMGRADDLIGHLRSLTGLGEEPLDRPRESRGRQILGGREVELAFTEAPGLEGPCAVLEFMLNPLASLDLDALGLAAEQCEQLLRIGRDGRGLIVSAGPMRSGRTCLSHALLAEFRHPERKFISLEEPSGRPLEGVMHLRAGTLGSDDPSYLRAALRMDADTILLGDLGGPRVAALATEAAAKHTLILASHSASGALDSIARLRRMGLGPDELASSVGALVGQRLVQRLCGDCRTNNASGEPQEFFSAGPGCEVCRGTGYLGRVGLFEVLEIDDELRDLLAADAPLEEITRKAYWGGFTDLRTHGLRLAREGVTSLSEVLASTIECDEQ